MPWEGQAAGLGTMCPKMVFLMPPSLLLWGFFGEKYHLASRCLILILTPTLSWWFLPLCSCHPPKPSCEGHQRVNDARNIHPLQQNPGGQREQLQGVRCSKHREGKGFRV